MTLVAQEDYEFSELKGPPGGEWLRRPVPSSMAFYTSVFVDNKLTGTVLLAKYAVPKLRVGGSMTFTSGINKDRPPSGEVR